MMDDADYEPPMMPLDFDPHCFLSRAELVEVNRESIALGLSRTLPDEWLAEIAVDAVIPILGVWKHRSCQGQKNARLEIMVGPKLDQFVLWDVSLSRWATIKAKG